MSKLALDDSGIKLFPGESGFKIDLIITIKGISIAPMYHTRQSPRGFMITVNA